MIKLNTLLAEAKLNMSIPSDIKKLYSIFRKNGHQLYVVGGAVRDAILGSSPKDFDLATGAKPEEVEAALDDEAITSDLQAPPEDATSDDLAADIADDGDLDSLLEAVDIDIEDGDVVSDEFDAEDNKEKEKNKSKF